MARLAAVSSVTQIPLDLEPEADPRSRYALRAEFQRLPISRQLTFEQAMADSGVAICVRNLAEITARRVSKRCLTRSPADSASENLGSSAQEVSVRLMAWPFDAPPPRRSFHE